MFSGTLQALIGNRVDSRRLQKRPITRSYPGRQRLRLEPLEVRRLLAAHPAGADVSFGIFCAAEAAEIAASEAVEPTSSLSSQTPPGTSLGGSGAGGSNILTFVLDFKSVLQANTSDAFGNVVSAFDLTAFGFGVGSFDMVASAILAEVKQDFFGELEGTVAGPPGQDLKIDFVIGDIGVVPAGISEYYFVQIGTGIAGPDNLPLVLGVADLNGVRNSSGTGPNNGDNVGDVVASVFTDEIVALFNLSPSNALTSGNLTYTRKTIAGILSHEIGHALSLSHINKAGSVQPTSDASPIMGTGALDLLNNDWLGESKFSLSGVDGENGNAPRQHVQQLLNALGLTPAPTVFLSGSQGTESDALTQSVSWSVDDINGNLQAVFVVVQRNGVVIQNFATTAQGTFNLDNAGTGNFTTNVTALYALGRTTQTSRSVTVIDDDTTPPDIEFGGAAGIVDISDDSVVTFGVTDPSGVYDQDIVVDVFQGGQLLQHTTGLAFGEIHLAEFGYGVFQIRITATDSDNDWSGDDASITAARSLKVAKLGVVGPAGDPFRVNTRTASDQAAYASAMDAEGNYVVVWNSAGQDGDAGGVYGQRYNAAGIRQGNEFRINATTAGDQVRIDVAMNATGQFVVTWDSAESGGAAGIYAQRFDRFGNPLGGELVIAHRVGTLLAPQVAMDAAGNFVVTWDERSSLEVYARRYNSAGVPQGDEFLVSTIAVWWQGSPDVAMDPAGNFIVVWYSLYQDGAGAGIYAQRYNASAVPLGTEFRINTTTAGDQSSHRIAMDENGNFVVTWFSTGQDPDGSTGVYAQRYNAVGVSLGDEFRVSMFTAGTQDTPRIGMDVYGDFVIAWDSYGQDPDGSVGVYAQRFSATGVPQGSEFRVNTYTAGTQYTGGISLDADGGFVVIWSSHNQDGDGSGVYAQRYAAPSLLGDVNEDGFVNIFDINLVSVFWGSAGPTADANYDGIVNIFDINMISANWGTSGGGGGGAGATSVDESGGSTSTQLRLPVAQTAVPDANLNPVTDNQPMPKSRGGDGLLSQLTTNAWNSNSQTGGEASDNREFRQIWSRLREDVRPAKVDRAISAWADELHVIRTGEAQLRPRASQRLGHINRIASAAVDDLFGRDGASTLSDFAIENAATALVRSRPLSLKVIARHGGS